MQNALRFLMKKKSFVSLRNNFWSSKKREKNIYQCKKNLSFSSEIWGHFAFTFYRCWNQNMRSFIFCRYCPPIVFCPQIWKTKRTQKWRAITLNFWDEVFSLSMPSVCPRLTTVHLCVQGGRICPPHNYCPSPDFWTLRHLCNWICIQYCISLYFVTS